ncbi:hypothetical protein [Qipengyuania thermophila]|uniref:hypothetical protein n=1 Tax=Qipengyuania thermophila TaxID=2509361 RepID=UPI0013E9F46B|nr:hypothetical protein [Qipengyuania thermophila]
MSNTSHADALSRIAAATDRIERASAQVQAMRPGDELLRTAASQALSQLDTLLAELER